MTIIDFTPIPAALGGALIGLSATFILLYLGRIAGISGMISQSMAVKSFEKWRLVFLMGLMLGGFSGFYANLGPRALSINEPLPMVAFSGLLVGFGAVLGSGCTSGHGICGVARLSVRSIVATVLFMGAAMMTVYRLGV